MSGLSLVLNEEDNVAVALKSFRPGEIALIDCKGNKIKLRMKQDVPRGHKFAIAKINRGESIIKYGEVIGKATRDIMPGEWIHIHNIVSARV